MCLQAQAVTHGGQERALNLELAIQIVFKRLAHWEENSGPLDEQQGLPLC